jgi:hypothetical protein
MSEKKVGTGLAALLGVQVAPGVEDVKELPEPTAETKAESEVRASLLQELLSVPAPEDLVAALEIKLAESEKARDEAEKALSEANHAAIAARAAVDAIRGKLLRANPLDPAKANVAYIQAQIDERFAAHAQSQAKLEAAHRLGLLTDAEVAKLGKALSPIDQAIATRNIQNRRAGLTR